MIARVPKFAERHFATACSDAGALAHKAEEDENGWDYFVEFPRDPQAGHADTHLPGKTAYVQVKSTTGPKLETRIKLSNALRAAQSRQPWFIVLIVARNGKKPVRIFATHIWADAMRQTLESVRRAETQKKPLHKQHLTIKFTAADERGDGVIDWMKSEIDRTGDGYEDQKKALHQTLGYEDGHGTGQLSVQGANTDEIVEGFLGLGKGLKITKFTYTPSRFGIPDPLPHVDVSEGKIFITPEPVADCEVRLRVGSEAITLPGKVYAFGTEEMPVEQRRVRFSAKFIEAISAAKSTDIKFRITFDADRKADLLTLWEFCTVRHWVGMGSVDLQVWAEGKRVLGGHLALGQPDGNKWNYAATFLRSLRTAAGSAEGKVTFALNDLLTIGPRDRLFQTLNDAGNLRLEFIPLEGSPEKIETVFFYATARVGDWSFYKFIKCSVDEDVLIEGQRRVTFKKASVLDSYALEGSHTDHEEMAEKDYKRFVDQEGGRPTVLSLGEMYAFIQSISSPDPAENRL